MESSTMIFQISESTIPDKQKSFIYQLEAQLISAYDVNPVPPMHIGSLSSFRCCLLLSMSSLLPLVLKTRLTENCPQYTVHTP